MNYRPNLGFEYPERSDEHMITVKHLRDTHFDENYQYLPKGFWHKVSRAVLWVLLNTVVFFVVWLRHGVKIFGRDKLKKHKKEFKDGAITVANHVFMWDYLCVLMAIRPRLQYHPGWKTNFEGPNGPLIRWVGGIPVPTDNIRAMAKFQRAIGDVLKNKHWLHFFPEGSMWFYYPDVRPFKKAVFKYAVRHNKPIIPIGISFRERKGLWKLIGKRPLVNVTIGDPIFPDKTVPETEAIDKIHAQTYHEVQVLCGVNPGDPTYNTDQNIDNYQSTYKTQLPPQ
ncbi:MAG: 1-acyl-sn-glycerol-3-phosphate acyltransferase [Clostridia bacterium]|nr:1-acyl-sn-glycerol-3-phosphate acyltransferase [Clostridia bacterium]